MYRIFNVGKQPVELSRDFNFSFLAVYVQNTGRLLDRFKHIKPFILKAAIQHNWAALPRLVPGANTVELRSQNAISSPGITFELAWKEGGRERTLRRLVSSDHNEFRVEVESDSPPRMRRVVLTRGG